ncbi:Sugar phosphate permease [Dethiosulfatibacter aminovorans DSM 17477]|uniref:Sugar phosphate permease n=1 Tax=Dethiosulfatibacter aminovorans DSM 17477 TaxID=1121476 RepID=A0A1M6AA37_9FIRM|nr:MFS transporter [Dethiosulfatibacter aminovorans]SHI33277.1 Sugar phosphate permease [Dethiosulfatibacter aminovorans DSM 17477]
MNSKFSKYLLIVTLGLAGGSIYFLPYIKYVFYDAHIACMNISNTQSGLLMTAYTIANMILYIPGGIIADRVSTKKALIFSCLGTSALVFLYSFNMENFAISMLIWMGLAFSTGFVIWASLLKTIRIIGTEKEQGFLYGLYYSCNGIAATIINILAVYVFQTGIDMKAGYFRACIFGGFVPIVVSIILMVLLKDEDCIPSVEDGEPKFHMADVSQLLKNPVVWIISIIVFCGYGFYMSVSYFTPYLTEVVGISMVDSGFLSAIRTYLLLLLAPVGGLLVDKCFKSTSKWLCVSFVILSGLFGAVLLLPADINPQLASIYTLIPGALVMMSYGVITSIVSEVGIPKAMTGTVIGIISIVGYMPDSIYSIMFGNWMDKYEAGGYNLIFGFLALSGIIAAVLSFVVLKYSKKNKIKCSDSQLQDKSLPI